MRQAAKAYLETQVTTTSQGQILIMLYDGAIKFLTQAKERMALKDYAGKGNLISNAIDIINELAGSLNAEKGGELAANLNQLYFYCNKRLFTANLKMDITPIDEVIKILSGLRSAYAQIVDTPEAKAAAAQAAASRPSNAQPGRTPLGAPSAPAGPAAGSARAQTAYASQVVQSTPENAPQNTPASPQASAQAALAEAPTLPVAEAAPSLPPLDLPDVAPSAFGASSLSAGKRMAASTLYQKFAS